MPQVRDATIEVDSDDGPLRVYEAVPAERPTRAVVVIQEAFGVNDHIADVTRRFAAAGYHAVAPHLFQRAGVNALPYEMDLAMAQLAKLTAPGLRTDIAATIGYLTSQGFPLPSIGIVGFCMGGSVVVAAAVEHAFGAAVTFYGGGIVDGRFGFPPLAELAPQLRAPWLGLYGDLDRGIPPEQVELLRSAAANAPVPTSVVRYPGAGHAFHCDARPANYHEASATDGWARTLDWLDRYLRPRD